MPDRKSGGLTACLKGRDKGLAIYCLPKITYYRNKHRLYWLRRLDSNQGMSDSESDDLPLVDISIMAVLGVIQIARSSYYTTYCMLTHC